LTRHAPACVHRAIVPDLATVLVQEGLVAPEAMERAVLRQKVCGGTLDSALLELELLDERVLVLALARVAGLPPSPPVALADPDPRIRRLFPARLAERHGIAPFRLDGHELVVLASWPDGVAALPDAAAALPVRLTAHVAPEWRVRELVYRVYGLAAGERYERLAERTREREAQDDPLAFDIDVVFELPPAAPAGDEPGAPQARATLADAREALASARTRDEVVRAALRYARGSFEFAALVGVGRDAVFGHDALGEEPGARERARRFSRPVAESGIVGSVVATGAPQLRRVAPDDPLLVALGRGAPQTSVLEPVRLRGKVAAVLYADNGPVPVSPAGVRDLLAFAAGLGPAFERIVRSRRAGAVPAR
jgi:hypothetical protein